MLPGVSRGSSPSSDTSQAMELRFEGVVTAGGGGGNDSSSESSEKCSSSSLLLLELLLLQLTTTSSVDPLHTSLCLSIEPARVRGGNFPLGDNISPSDLLSRFVLLFLSELFVLEGEIFGTLYVGDSAGSFLNCMFGPGYMVTGCSLYGLSLNSLEKPMKGKTGGFSTLGDFLRLVDGALCRGGNQAAGAASAGGGRAPCCSDANRYGGTGGCCSWKPLASVSFSQP